jgi:coenzyme PQQ precursor peptide PqqA
MRRRFKEGVRRQRAICPKFLRQITVSLLAAAANVYEGNAVPSNIEGSTPMSWTTPTLVEVCIGLEINGYLPADGFEPPEF